MPAWLYPAVSLGVSVASSIFGASATAKAQQQQAENQRNAARYNATAAYNTALNNIKLSAILEEANLDTLLAQTEFSNDVTDQTMSYNASLISNVALYNDALYEKDIESVWAQAGLDTDLLQKQRLRERGSMVASQSASGTVIGEGSNADALVDQMTQEAMEVFVIKTGAADKAASITNARMQSLYQAQQQIAKIEFEGNLQKVSTKTAASIKGQTILTEGYLNRVTDLTNATTQLNTGLAGAEVNFGTTSAKISNDFTSGMFGAINTGISGAAELYGRYGN